MSPPDPAPTRAPAPQPPLLLVVSGDPSEEELAALVAVLTSAAPGGAGHREPSSATPTHSAWRDRTRLLRRPPAAGPGAWRASAWRH